MTNGTTQHRPDDVLELVAREVFALDADWRREYWDRFRRDFARQAQAYYDTADRILGLFRTPSGDGQAGADIEAHRHEEPVAWLVERRGVEMFGWHPVYVDLGRQHAENIARVMRDGEWDARIVPLYRAALRSEAPGQAWRAFMDAVDEFEVAVANLWADPDGPTAADMERLRQSRRRVIGCARALASIRPEAHAARTIAGGGRTGERSRRWTCSRRRAMASETMERPVHNHDPEQGPGLACRESLIGDCIRAEYAHLTRELDAARAENQRLREALERVADGGCERFYGTDCWQMGMGPNAKDYADRVCDPCFARRALAKDTEVSNGA